MSSRILEAFHLLNGPGLRFAAICCLSCRTHPITHLSRTNTAMIRCCNQQVIVFLNPSLLSPASSPPPPLPPSISHHQSPLFFFLSRIPLFLPLSRHWVYIFSFQQTLPGINMRGVKTKRQGGDNGASMDVWVKQSERKHSRPWTYLLSLLTLHEKVLRV